jgi:hypothetical protein
VSSLKDALGLLREERHQTATPVRADKNILPLSLSNYNLSHSCNKSSELSGQTPLEAVSNYNSDKGSPAIEVEENVGTATKIGNTNSSLFDQQVDPTGVTRHKKGGKRGCGSKRLAY